MKETQSLLFYMLFTATLKFSNAYQPTRYVLTDKLDVSNSPSIPTKEFDTEINEYLLKEYNFESKKIPTTQAKEENEKTNTKYNEMVKDSTNIWRMSTVNGEKKEVPQMQILKSPLVLPSRGFPISSVHLDLAKVTTHIPTEAPINVEEIRFGPSASHVATVVSKKIKHDQPHIIFPRKNRNTEYEHGHSYKTVDKLESEEMKEVTSHKINIADDEVTTVKHVSSTLPPVPTLSPWLDGFGK